MPVEPERFHLRSLRTRALRLTSVLLLICGALRAAQPLTGPDLVLWLDASDVDGDGTAPLPGKLAVWHDKSPFGHHAVQEAVERQPVLVTNAAGPGLHAVRFEAARGQFLSSGTAANLDLKELTAFVVARAERHGSDMWLFSKNRWEPSWTGYGLAISGAGMRPWPHAGCNGGGRVYFQFAGDMESAFRLIEVSCDGTKARGSLEGTLDTEQAAAGVIAVNDQPLTIGTLGEQYLQGEIC